jgi:hypothetical protein
VRLVNILDRCGRFLDQLARAQLAECSPCVIQGALQDPLDCPDAFGVQALLSLHWTNKDERITDKLLLLRRHQSSLQYLQIKYLFRHVTYPPIEQRFNPMQAAWRCSRLVALALDEEGFHVPVLQDLHGCLLECVFR